MVHSGILIETIGIPVLVSVGFLLLFSTGMWQMNPIWKGSKTNNKNEFCTDFNGKSYIDILMEFL